MKWKRSSFSLISNFRKTLRPPIFTQDSTQFNNFRDPDHKMEMKSGAVTMNDDQKLIRESWMSFTKLEKWRKEHPGCGQQDRRPSCLDQRKPFCPGDSHTRPRDARTTLRGVPVFLFHGSEEKPTLKSVACLLYLFTNLNRDRT